MLPIDFLWDHTVSPFASDSVVACSIENRIMEPFSIAASLLGIISLLRYSTFTSSVRASTTDSVIKDKIQLHYFAR